MSFPEKTQHPSEGSLPRSYEGLREWLDIVESIGELKRINGADWNLEIGTVAELVYRKRPGVTPAILFDRIKDYPKGFRLLFGLHLSCQRLALTFGLPLGSAGLGLVNQFRQKMKELKPIPPRTVQRGPVLENEMAENDIDLLKFPVPLIHEHDGGRFIGTACVAITRDPEEGWLNLGTYRAMVHDRKSMGLMMSAVSKHGRVHMEKYFRQGKPCPIILCVGQDPLLSLAAGSQLEFGYSEYDYCGGVRGRPVDTLLGKETGLPFPAHAEIVLEGFMHPGDVLPEGPFGEWMGYYGARTTETPVIQVERVYYRNDPVLCCASPGRPPSDDSLYLAVVHAAQIWDHVEKAGLPNVKGVWCMEAGIGTLFNVISIKQAYPGHARQALVLASQVLGGAYIGRFVVVVDEDIDPTNLYDVIWAMSTRCDPQYSIEIIRRCWSGNLDIVIPQDKKGLSSRALVDACKPYERRDEFSLIAESSETLKEAMTKKWKEEIFG